MKETIKYYYNIEVENLEEDDGKYHFKINNQDYFFVYYNRSINELNDLIKCASEVKNSGFDVHNMIININGEYLTKINDYYYILFSSNNIYEKYDIFDILNFSNKLILNNKSTMLYRNNWHKLWCDKIDYYEYQIREMALNKEIIRKSISYYIGLAENAISYAENTSKQYENMGGKIALSHRRIFYPNYKLNFLNPLSFIFDLQVRDIAEYLKAIFFSKDNDETILELSSYLKVAKLNIYEYQMLYARLLYPSYYFDLYDSIINKERNEECLVDIIGKVNDYEIFLKKAYLEISKYANIEKVSWLIN